MIPTVHDPDDLPAARARWITTAAGCCVYWTAIVCSGPAFAAGCPCAADFNNDCTLDASDAIGYVSAFGAGDPDADLAEPLGVHDYSDVLVFLVSFGAGCGAFDADADGLPDCHETNDGVYRSPTQTGTDPCDPDTDGDAIIDGDEVLGSPGGLDLPALGADPLRRDLFVELDWYEEDWVESVQFGCPCAGGGELHSHRPSQEVLDALVAAFAAAPVLNPDGSMGVALHIDVGQGGGYTGGNAIVGGGACPVSGPAVLGEIRAANFAPERFGYFRYALMAHVVRRGPFCTQGSGVTYELVSDEFVIGMSRGSTPMALAGTFMHELGHTLGLDHGGDECANRKPNYHSVMNDAFRTLGTPFDCTDTLPGGVLDYSDGSRVTIPARGADESRGICAQPGFPVDLNGNGQIDLAPVDVQFENCGGTSFVRDHDDWSNLRYEGIVGR